jgi:trimethylguanosine synthase
MASDENVPVDAIELQLARDMLGPFVDAPTAQLLLPQASQIPQAAWEIIRKVLEQNPQSREDVSCLTKLLAEESQAVIGVKMGGLDTNDAVTSSDFSLKPAERLPLTDKCHHYKGQHEVPWDIQKLVLIYLKLASAQCANQSCRYFSQRYSIFSFYDGGVHMTDDAWFGVTPEPVAK